MAFCLGANRYAAQIYNELRDNIINQKILNVEDILNKLRVLFISLDKNPGNEIQVEKIHKVAEIIMMLDDWDALGTSTLKVLILLLLPKNMDLNGLDWNQLQNSSLIKFDILGSEGVDLDDSIKDNIRMEQSEEEQ